MGNTVLRTLKQELWHSAKQETDMKYTFAWCYQGPFTNNWQFSKQRLDTIEAASVEMAKFAAVCYENDVVIHCKLITIIPE